MKRDVRGVFAPDVDRQSYWEWVSAALFLLLPVDLLTTLYSAAVVGPQHEANPWMAWLLAQPVPVIVGIHTAVGMLVVAGFFVYESVSVRSEAYGNIMLRAARLYLFLLVCVGFAVFVNNLAVIVFRRSLVALLVGAV